MGIHSVGPRDCWPNSATGITAGGSQVNTSKIDRTQARAIER